MHPRQAFYQLSIIAVSLNILTFSEFLTGLQALTYTKTKHRDYRATGLRATKPSFLQPWVSIAGTDKTPSRLGRSFSLESQELVTKVRKPALPFNGGVRADACTYAKLPAKLLLSCLCSILLPSSPPESPTCFCSSQSLSSMVLNLLNTVIL